MFIEEINIENFRNYEKQIIEPNKNLNLFIGNNAQGKTNFLESIYLTSNLKSFRGKNISETIKNKKEKSKILLKLQINKVTNILVLEIDKNNKNIYLNNKKPNKFSESLGFLETVLFYPDDIIVVKGSPALRRNLLDRAIFQTDKSYLPLFQEYMRCLKQRNAALKGMRTVADLWDEQFINLASRITFCRTSYIERINGIFGNFFSEIYRSREQVRINYPVNVNNISNYREKFREKLLAGREKERLYGMTLIGPHRDDPQFLLNEKPLSLYGSQGQQRSFMLAFKTAQILDVKERRGIRPVLLLDDMTSELDDDRKDAFFESLLNLSGQVFITSTDKELLKYHRFSDARFFRVENGKIDEFN